ncbi:TIGR02996 domain-containing protein [Myxococcus sp. K15C18031901]|uniref:TIGR02996 domain-containing protein n=1 Tax=Myxococcus dinghuensis TaxID=2906761 RepID=UPI0020A7BC2C|nr:TIGR02996 domain-containing protein [Myxococcus dinghuensis]MCP3102750.1 TIGR02996 domain-containing protein [Myxococcus dinghuensis]
MADFDLKGFVAKALQGVGDFFRPPAPPPPVPAPVDARNPELEAAILQDPEDDAAYLVYGDWLQEQGDPRGQLMALHHAVDLAQGAEREALWPRVLAFAEQHERQLMGDASDWGALVTRLRPFRGMGDDHLLVRWHLGFIASITVSGDSLSGESVLDVNHVLERLLRHPAARFLRTLSVGPLDSSLPSNDYRETLRLVAAHAPRTLRSLAFMDPMEFSQGLSLFQLGDASALYAAFPRLRALSLNGNMVLGEMNLPELRELSLESSGLTREVVEAVAAAHWPHLEKLVLRFGVRDLGCDVTPEDLRPLLEGTRMPRLRHLGLRNAEFTDALCELLPAAPVLGRLEQLDLSMGMMTKRGADALMAHADRFAHLLRLDVTENLLDADAVDVLDRLGEAVHLGGQRAGPPVEPRDSPHRWTVAYRD